MKCSPPHPRSERLWAIFVILFAVADISFAGSAERRQIASALFAIPEGQIDINPGGAYYDYNSWGSSPNGTGTCDGYDGGHSGIDMRTHSVAGPLTADEPFYAVSEGVVIAAGGSSLNTIAVYDAANDRTVLYLHARTVNVAVSDPISVGTLLGIQGDEGSPGAEHVHVEVRAGQHTNAACGAAYTLDPEPVLLAYLDGAGGATSTQPNVGLSASYALDTRIDPGVTAAESNVFATDARNRGNGASGGSGSFTLNTIQSTLNTVAITGGATAIIAGEPYPYTAQATFANGIMANVSTGASWRFVGPAPAGTQFEGNVLTTGDVDEATVITLRASYVFPSGSRDSPSYAVTVYPGARPYRVIASYTTLPLSSAWWRVFFGVVSAGPEGGASAANIHWDLDGDGAFDDATGGSPSRDYYVPQGKSFRLGVRASWPQPGGGSETVTQFFYLVLNKPDADGEPVSMNAVDIAAGAFSNGDGNLNLPEPSNAPNGLVVLAHGMFGSRDDPWMKEMFDAVTARLSAAPPNVAIYDWKEMADPESYTTAEATSGSDQPVLRQLDDYARVRPYGKAQGIIVANWIDEQEALSRVSKTAPVHLVGHSAGGFAMGETARLLNQRGYTKVQVTMLDTPVPYHEHIQSAWKVDRYISSFFGGDPKNADQAAGWNLVAKTLNSRVDFFRITCYRRSFFDLLEGVPRQDCTFKPDLVKKPGARYYRTVVPTSAASLPDQHSDAHQFYIASIEGMEWEGAVPTDGFNYSPLLFDGDFTIGGGGEAGAQEEAQAPLALGEAATPGEGDEAASDEGIPIAGFDTFGDVAEAGGVYTITEELNAGLTGTFELPWDTVALRFSLRFLAEGDGDFVSVHWGEEPVIGIVPETEMGRNHTLEHEFPLSAWAGETSVLTIKLVSRGDANSVIEISAIEIVTSDDVDGDGLGNDEEIAIGSDPLMFDTDGDGLDDPYEVQTTGTHPALADSDGDGNRDGEELQAGTDPLDAGSFFRVVDFDSVTQGSYTLAWPGRAGKSYRIQRSTELGSRNFDTIASGLPGVEGLMSYTDSPPAPWARAFYWVEVE